MADYTKKVIYLSYMKSGSKVKGAGFIKLENSCGSCRLDMHISGLGYISDKQYDIKAVMESEKEIKIGRIYLHNGNGEWCGNVEEKDIPYSSIYKISVRISDYEAVDGVFNSRQAVQQEDKAVKGFFKRPELRAADSIVEKIKGDVLQEGKSRKEKVKDVERTKIREKQREAEKAVRNQREKGLEREKEADKQSERITQSEGEKQAETEQKQAKLERVIMSDKWEQLRQLYPVIHPYEDDREYISIKPKDFVIMTGDYQHLANNSFLLHGFYNYRHIILGKEESTETDNFYLGVPGVYYEREKMVALMFGFEAFECSGGKAEPGKFGYYLKKVKI